MRTVPHPSAEALAQHNYYELQTSASGLCRILSIERKTITFIEKGDPQTVSIDRIAQAPSTFPCQLEKPHNRDNESVLTPRDEKHEQVKHPGVLVLRDEKDKQVKHPSVLALCDDKVEQVKHPNVSALRDVKNKKDAVSDNDYVVGKIVPHERKAPDRIYFAQYCWCSAAHDRLKPPEHIL